MKYAEAADRYMTWARVKYKTSISLGNNIPFNVRAFGVFMHNPNIEDVTVNDVAKYVELMLALGWHPNTVCRKVSHLRNFFHFLQLQGLKVMDYRVIPAPQPQFSEPGVITEEQYRKIVSVIPSDGWYGPRDLAQISLLHDTGMRVGELLSLNVGDVDVLTKHQSTNGVVLYRGTVRTEKQRRLPFRQIFWREETNQNLIKWLHVRDILVNRYGSRTRDPHALFIGASAKGVGRRPRPAVVDHSLRKYAAAAGIKERIHPHMFRHAFARSRVLGGADTSAIASLLGHVNIESSGVYTRLYGKHLQEAYTRFMPDQEESGAPKKAKHKQPQISDQS